MGWTNLASDKIEFIEASVELPPPVKKQIWDGEKFVPVVFYRRNGTLDNEQKQWLFDNFGHRGPRWDYSLTGNFWIMDEKVYVWFQLKWDKK